MHERRVILSSVPSEGDLKSSCIWESSICTRSRPASVHSVMLLIVLTLASLVLSVHGEICSQTPDRDGHVSITKTITHIEKAAFNACSSIKSVFIHKDVTIIDKQAFYRTENLERIEFEEGSGLQIIESLAFFKSGLKEMNIPPSLLRIGASAFANIANLKNFNIPKNSNLLSISPVAFSATGLESFEWPPLVEDMSASLFLKTPALKSVTFSDDSRLKNIDKFAFKESNLDTITIPKHVQTIGVQAFYSNAGMRSVYFAAGCNNTVEIDNLAFFGTNITRLEIPNSAECFRCGVSAVVRGCGSPPPSAKEQAAGKEAPSEQHQLTVIGATVVGMFAIAFVMLYRSETAAAEKKSVVNISARASTSARMPRNARISPSPEQEEEEVVVRVSRRKKN